MPDTEPDKFGMPLVAALVVGYFPDAQILKALLHSLAPQVAMLYLIDNGGCDAIDIAAIPGCKLISFGRNLGLGYALNAGFAAAVAEGASYVATFDQDSAPPQGLISGLLRQHLELQQQGIRCAAVSPTFFDRREQAQVNFPFYREQNKVVIATVPSYGANSEAIEADLLITSGMLVKASAWQDGLSYDEGMFVDYTDTEWCFRARSLGYRLFGCTSVQMGHALSDAPPLRVFKLNFFHYPPLRRYYYFRNTILLCKKHYVSFAWKKRLLTGLTLRFFVSFLYEKERIKQFTMMCKGIKAGLTNQAGPFVSGKKN